MTSCGNEVEEIKDPASGKLLKRYEYYTDDSGQKIKDGEFVEWDATGQKIAALHYANDSLDGQCVYYLDNGSVWEKNFSNGSLSGIQTLKSAEGKVLVRENYAGNKLNGKQEYLSPSGTRQRRSFFQNGQPSGTWQFYDEKGKKSFALNFRNGVCQELVGKWNVSEERATSMEFGKDGSFKLYAPYFDRYGDPVLRMDGSYQVDGMLHAIHRNGMTLDYELFSVDKDTIILISNEAESPESAITELIRKK